MRLSSIENGISVLVERDVERAGRHVVAVDVVNRLRDSARQRHAAGTDADERQLLDAPVALEHFVRDSRQRPAHAVGIHHDRHGEPPARIG
jgi:hypothetical protein